MGYKGEAMNRLMMIISLVVLALPTIAISMGLPDLSQCWAEAENCGRFTIAPGGGENLVNDSHDYKIHVWCLDINGNAISLPATDITLYHPDLSFCPGQSSQADTCTNSEGYTSISGTISGALEGDGTSGLNCEEILLYVMVYDIIINDGEPVCVAVDSPDLNGDLEVSLADFAKFSYSYQEAHEYDPCHDYSEDGMNSVADLAVFALYYRQAECD